MSFFGNGMREFGLAIALLALVGCEGLVMEPPGTGPGPRPGIDDPPIRESVGPAVHPSARRVQRLTAEQYHRSLTVATGQPWADFERFAAAMGRPDYTEVTDEGLELSVTFDKLVHDASRASCAAAIDTDVAGMGGEPTILRFATPSDRAPMILSRNLQYLFLRFLATEVIDDEDPRLDPWMTLLLAPTGGEDVTDEDMQNRWEAVCIGLATHPDFLAY